MSDSPEVPATAPEVPPEAPVEKPVVKRKPLVVLRPGLELVKVDPFTVSLRTVNGGQILESISLTMADFKTIGKALEALGGLEE